MNNSVFQISRSIWESEINYKPAEWFKIWVYLIGNVSFKKTSFLERGEGYFNLVDVSRTLSVPDHTAYNFIKWAKSTKQNTTRKTTRGIYIKIVNYSKYQDIVKRKNQTGNQTENEIGTRQELDRNQTIIEEGKKVRNKEVVEIFLKKGFEGNKLDLDSWLNEIEQQYPNRDLIENARAWGDYEFKKPVKNHKSSFRNWITKEYAVKKQEERTLGL